MNNTPNPSTPRVRLKVANKTDRLLPTKTADEKPTYKYTNVLRTCTTSQDVFHGASMIVADKAFSMGAFRIREAAILGSSILKIYQIDAYADLMIGSTYLDLSYPGNQQFTRIHESSKNEVIFLRYISELFLAFCND